MRSRHEAQSDTESRLDSTEMIGSKFANRLSHTALFDFAFADNVDEFASIDFDRARSRAESVASTSDIAQIFELFDEAIETSVVFVRLLQASNFALNHNALARR